MPSSLPIPNKCVCGGCGYFRYAIDDIHHPLFGKALRCVCQQAADVRVLQAKLGTPTRAVGLQDVLERSEASKNMRVTAERFINGNVNFYTLFGRNGTGKTTTLMAITNELMARGRACVYVTAADLMATIKDGIHHQDKNDQARLDQFAKLPALCIDELTQLNWTGYVTEKLESLLDRRYRAGRPTALAMDQDPEAVLPARFSSRLRSGAYLQVSDLDMRPLLGQRADRLRRNPPPEEMGNLPSDPPAGPLPKGMEKNFADGRGNLPPDPPPDGMGEDSDEGKR
jgi:hypothetical protein